jgi:hypothetical protein
MGIGARWGSGTRDPALKGSERESKPAVSSRPDPRLPVAVHNDVWEYAYSLQSPNRRFEATA